ncbi:MAG: ribonuclease HII [Ruminococcaceae bacterium]|nr:ribonuclease HII [Oscillospiraceae bacterium]
MDFDILEYEKKYWNMGCKYVAGADEAGRGPLAGPVYAAAVILKPGTVIEGLTDSKKLSEKKRDYYFDVIKETALCYSIASVDEKTIDEINILNATYLAFRKAVEGLSIKPEIALIDGNRMGDLPCEKELIIKGDQKSLSIAAASVLAKVSRDRHMDMLDEIYPQYGFKKHKAYGTKAHYEALQKYGASDVHRKSFRLFK